MISARNKKVRNAVIPYLRKIGIKKEDQMKLANSLQFHNERVRELAPEDFGTLTNEVLYKLKNQ